MLNEIDRNQPEHRHWCPVSEKYAGGDVLYNFLSDGWHVVDQTVKRQCIWHGSARQVVIFHFRLRRLSQVVDMQVIQNPFVEQLIHAKRLCILDTTKQPVTVKQTN